MSYDLVHRSAVTSDYVCHTIISHMNNTEETEETQPLVGMLRLITIAMAWHAIT